MSAGSTPDRLVQAKGRSKPDLWERVTGIPEFDPTKHSDGCSGGMSAFYAALPQSVRDRYGEMLPWRECCVVHDRAYYYGGTREEKRTADQALKDCVAATLGDSIAGELLASSMEWAVTIGGQPFFATSYRWGYGEDFRGT